MNTEAAKFEDCETMEIFEGMHTTFKIKVSNVLACQTFLQSEKDEKY